MAAPARTPRLNPAHSPEQIASSPKVRDVKISPDGRIVLYQVQEFYRAGDRNLAALWLAQTGVPESAKQLTDGQHNDRSGVFHPDGTRIFFLSDRLAPGKSSHVYILEREKAQWSEPRRLEHDFGGKGVLAFDISPDGEYMVVSGTEKTTEDEKAKIASKDDAKSFGVLQGATKLRLYDLASRTLTPISSVREDKQLENVAWALDSRSLLIRYRENKGSEYSEMKILLERVAVVGDSTATQVGSYPRSPSGQSIVTSRHILDLQNYHPATVLDARTLFCHSIEDDALLQTSKLYGDIEDAVRVVHTQYTRASTNERVAVEIATGVDTRIDIVDVSDGVLRRANTIYKTDREAIWFGAWDAKEVIQEDGDTMFVFAGVLSSVIKHEAPNVWTQEVRDGKVINRTKLSSHLQWLVEATTSRIKTEVVSWKSTDGCLLDGLVRYPVDYVDGGGPYPTILFIHGGPYRRDIPDYMPYFCNWRELLASAGYLVLSPNYRGSQGRGHKFAVAAMDGIGAYDWPDCMSMIQEMKERGLVDPERLGVAGWSHGGSLAAWGITQTKNIFKAAVVGAGATSWEGMVAESGSPELEAAIGGIDAWTEGKSQKESPMRMVKGVETAVLILHGERDERVPVGQAVGFYRGLKRHAATQGASRAELVVYPREPHGFVERKHAEDVMRRVLLHFNACL